MCLFEKEESHPFPQGGTYDQYRRWLSEHPDDFGVQPLDPFLVWRSRVDPRVSSEARCLDQDQRSSAFCTAALWALRGDRLFGRPRRLRHQWRAYPGGVLRAAPALCDPLHGVI